MNEPEVLHAADTARMANLSARDGTRLCARVEGSGPPVLMLHEFAAADSCFAGFRTFFDGFQRIELFARGYDPSGRPDDSESYSQDIAVDDCVDALDALGIAKAHFVGVSMGASTALLMALRHSDRVASATLMSVGGGGLPDTRAAWVAQMETMAGRFETEDPAEVAKAFLGGPSRRGLMQRSPAMAHEVMAELGNRPGWVSSMILRRVLLRRPMLTDLEDELGANRAPMLVISGTEDAAAVTAGDYLVAGNVEHITVPDAGHTPQLDQPERVAEHTLRFIAAHAQ